MLFLAMRPVCLLLALLRLAVAELTFTATAFLGGQEVDMSTVEFLPIPPQGSSWQNIEVPDLSPSTSADASRRVKKEPQVGFSSTWCGVSQHQTKTSNPITSVNGVIHAPNLTLRPNNQTPQVAAAWVGVDGASCRTALFQAGVTTIINSDGGQSASGWWQWLPDQSYAIPSGFGVKPNDQIAINVTITNVTTGRITLTNWSQLWTITIDATSGTKLCRQDAEWIVEPLLTTADGSYPLPRFDQIPFRDCFATTLKGPNIGIDASAIIYLGSSTTDATCVATAIDGASFDARSQG